MADFCKQCSEEHFGEDHGDLRGLGNGKPLESGYGWVALCEGCGPIIVDEEGRCLSSDCLIQHGKENEQRVKRQVRAELIKNPLAKRKLLEALEILFPSPEGKYLDIDGIDGEVPGQLRITCYWIDVPDIDEEY